MSRRLAALLSVPILYGALAFLLLPYPARAQDSALFVDSGQRLGGESSYGVALGDLDGDGDLDALVANGAGERSQVWKNDGRGNFVLAGDLPAAGETRDVALGDLDGDGDLDAFLANASNAPNTVWFNDGIGYFTGDGQQLGNGSSLAVVLADFDGDGFLDAYVANGQYADPTTGEVPNDLNLADELWFNDGTGRFSAPDTVQVLSDVSAQDVTAGDFDNNGYIDLYLATGQPQRAGAAITDQVWLNNGDRTFRRGRPLPKYRAPAPLALPPNCAPGMAPAFGAATDHLDDAGGLDIFVANGTDGCMHPNAVLLGSGSGIFAPTAQFPGAPASAVPPLTGNTAVAVALGDIDADGDIDALLANDESKTDDLWLNRGNELFERVPIDSPEFTVDVALGDLNGDGFLDAFLANRNNGPNRVLFNSALNRFDGRPLNTDLPGRNAAVGDLNSDGWLDAVVVNGEAGAGDDTIFIGDGAGKLVASTHAFTNLLARSVALGDLDGDGTLDAFVVNSSGYGHQVWLNADGTGMLNDTGQELGSDGGQDVAVGDLDGDGDLDAFVANGELDGERGKAKPNTVWFNVDGKGTFAQSSQRLGNGASMAVALGDLDGDGDLDAVVANARGTRPSEVLLNNGDGRFIGSQSLPVSDARGVALGDYDGDGDLDAFVVNGYHNQAHRVFLNDGSGNLVDSGQSLGATNGNDATAGDFDGDGDLDVLVASQGPNQLWVNDGRGNFTALAKSFGNTFSRAVVSGDFNRDGALDALVVNGERSGGPLYAGHHDLLINLSPAHTAAQIALNSPATVDANFYATTQIIQSLSVPFSYTVSSEPTGTLGQPELFFSFNGGGQWLSGAFTTGAAISGTVPAIWNLADSEFFGKSDNVALRLVVPLQPSAAMSGTYRYTNRVAGPYLWSAVSAATFPFRARGLQVRVVDEEGRGVAGAQVYRRPGKIGLLTPMVDAAGQPFVTDDLGYLQGRGTLTVGDQLAALAPITGTHAYTMYHTSAGIMPSGIKLYGVTKPNLAASGIQTLTVVPTNTLLLFDLDISLEWDARNDGTFLADLEAAVKRASDLIYDVTVGQVALGDVRIHLDKADWASADVVIYASNSIHPRASMGGVVIDYTDDYSGTTRIPNAYMPGQIRMGPLWDPFGQNQTDLQQDWWRAFAHELAHYLLFLPDNYLGVEDGMLVTTDCKGSFMTSAYDEKLYGGFLVRDGWVGPCLDTVAQRLLTGRTDWETITTFLPITAPLTSYDASNGPSSQLAVTQVHIVTDTLAAPGRDLLTARNFDLRDENGDLAVLRQAQGYVFRTGSTRGDEFLPSVIGLIALGSTGSGRDRIMVRGARESDRVCVFDTQHDPPRVGCTKVDGTNPTVSVAPLSGWQPDIVVSPVASTTVLITVTQLVEDNVLHAQLIPAYGPDGPPIETPVTLLRQIDPDNPQVWAGAITLTYPAFEGYVRVWVDSLENPTREAVTQYFLSAGFGPPGRGGSSSASSRTAWGPPGRGGSSSASSRAAWGPPGRGGSSSVDSRAMGASRRTMEAPVSSGDGRVTVFRLDDLLGDSGALSLQALNGHPHMASWLTPVGKAYRFTASEPFTRTIAFQYLQRDVPEGFEPALRLYFLPDDSTAWQPLDTRLDVDENLAAAHMPSAANGTYVLAASVELPQLQVGWNLLAYTIPETRTVDVALASIQGDFTTVYQYDAASPSGWRVFDASLQQSAPEFASLVNDLTVLNYGQSYLIYATSPVTPYLAVSGPQAASVTEVDAETSALPAAAPADAQYSRVIASQIGIAPAVYYGTVAESAQDDVSSPSALTVTARIGTAICGSTKAQQQAGQTVYVLRVASAAQIVNCGEQGSEQDAEQKIVEFLVGDQVMGNAVWNNSRAIRVDLAPMNP